MPLVHPPTFEVVSKPGVLINAMEACGALYGKTPTAAEFITTTLRDSREILIQEFVSNVTWVWTMTDSCSGEKFN